MHLRGIQWAALAVAVPALVVGVTAPAVACAGLVGENGTIRLTRTSTLAAYHNGVERYVTSFQFTGAGKEVGSIVPLPAVPTDVVRGGDWTLQRLEREVAPPIHARFAADSAKSLPNAAAEVLIQKKIDALDITILRGGGTAVGKWATDHGFLLSPDAPEVLDFYSRRSPIFMAARFDASRARSLGQNSGDGTPIMVTMPTREPWVPLRILGLGLDKDAAVNADVFLLTDNEPKLLAGGPGLALKRHEWATPELLADLRSDKGMGWIPDRMWFTYLPLDTTAGTLDYDLAMSTHPGVTPRLDDTGVQAEQAHPVVTDTGRALWPIAAGVLTGALAFGAAAVLGRRRPRMGAPA
jgi:Uncharacterized protein conserved in bacteria (DUF2330)